MKRSKTSVTILAALTIGLSGSLKVLALCSIYRTSHISAEILLKTKKWKGLHSWIATDVFFYHVMIVLFFCNDGSLH